MTPVKWGGTKFNDFQIKFATFAFANSKCPKTIRRSIKISKNLTISKKLEGPWLFLPPCHGAPGRSAEYLSGTYVVFIMQKGDFLSKRRAFILPSTTFAEDLPT